MSAYLNRAKLAGLTWPLPADMDEETLYKRLYPPAPSNRQLKRPEPDVHWIHQELKRKGVTLCLLWHEYRSQHPTGYGYSHFCNTYRQFCRTLKPSMRLTHCAGESLFVDYSGMTIPWVNGDTGEIHQAAVFVAVLGASNYTFLEATMNQSLQHWITSHTHAFDFLGGVPRRVVPDNLKSGVCKAHRYDPDINPTYQEMANHFGVAIVPARARAPKDKAKVEVGVQGIQRWILAPLRDHTFFSIQEINEAMAPLLTQYNQRPLSQLPNETRYSQFLALDKPALKSLPRQRYEFATWKKAKAGIDYHIAVDKHYYSVPHTYLKQTLSVRISAKTIRCFYKGKQIA